LDALVPVPIHWRRRWRRGFNQTDELALVLREHTGLPIEPLLRRHTNSSQAGLTHQRRRANVRQAFSVAAPHRAAGRRLLLIDDVFTTGATANACARTLKQAGAAHVSILALARADRRQLTEVLEERYE
jgi:ComF family protein